jgi:hypothetical protein
MNKRTWLMATVLMAACTEGGGGGGGSGGRGNVAGEGGGGSGGSNETGGANATGGTTTGGTVGTGGKATGGAGGNATGGNATGGNATGGASTGGTASGGTGGVAAVVPVASGNVYRFSWDTQLVEVDASTGGRITVFSQGGKNILTGPSANADNYGSTFWPSPQSAWGWPPPAEIDPGAYSARIEGATLILESKTDTKVKLIVTKRITVDRAAQALVIVYDMKNTSNAAADWAPWEITRVAPGGMTFFELGPGGTAPVAPSIPTALDVAAGWHWFDDAALLNTNNMGRKTFADGKGWVAHVARADRLLLVKTFEDIGANAHAKDEAEVEIYVDSARKYVEVENQGAVQSLAPGATRSWTVRWSLRVLPGNGALSVGSTEVVDAVKAVLPK